MITERTLRKWRQEALTIDFKVSHISTDEKYDRGTVKLLKLLNDLIDRNLRMTQELLDQHLLRRSK